MSKNVFVQSIGCNETGTLFSMDEGVFEMTDETSPFFGKKFTATVTLKEVTEEAAKEPEVEAATSSTTVSRMKDKLTGRKPKTDAE